MKLEKIIAKIVRNMRLYIRLYKFHKNNCSIRVRNIFRNYNNIIDVTAQRYYFFF